DGPELPDNQDLCVPNPNPQNLRPGGYVSVNNANNDYTFDANGQPIPDFMKQGPIVGEHDLVPLNIHKVVGAEGGEYYLHFTSDRIKIWKNNNRSDPVTSDSTPIPFDGTKDIVTVYVEGITKSASAAKEEVTLKWVKQDGNKTKEVIGDTV